jgi:hypothetical protein
MIEAEYRATRYNSDHLSPAAKVVSVELFRYRGAAQDGGRLEYVF